MHKVYVRVVKLVARIFNMPTTLLQGEADASQEDEKHRGLVKRVVSSPTFAKTERLSSFLLFICEETLKGRADRLNEQRIGEAVFGRSRDYDSSIDGIVRTQGSRLRQKLDRYFSEEGALEQVRIVIPRGGYIPVFETRQTSDETTMVSADAKATTVLSVPATKLSLWKRIARQYGSVTAICICIVLAAVILRHSYPSVIANAIPSNHPLWSNVFVPDRRTLVVPGDSGLVIWEGLEKKKLSLAEFLRGDYRNSGEEIADDLSKRRYTSIVDLEAAQTLTRIAAARKADLETRYARDLRMEDLKDDNVILIGAGEANPWVELYEPIMKFRFSKDMSTNKFSVLNVEPKSQEPRSWDFSPGTAYAIVAYLPGFKGSGNALLIGGTSMTGTESAIDFVTDDSQLLPLLKTLRRTNGSLPHFEAVLGTKYVNGSAVRSSVLASHALD